MTFEELFISQQMVGVIAKERDKFAEIVDAVGIDQSLLKNTADGLDSDQASKLPWRLPKESGPFIEGLLGDYTSKDFKALRKANFYGVSLETVKRLIDGFISMLGHLGYADSIIEEQQKKMSSRMHFDMRSSRKEIDAVIEELKDTLDKYEALYDMRKDEIPFFYAFVEDQIRETLSYIQEVHENYIDLRQEELNDQALEEAAQLDDTEDMERINQELFVQSALEQDPRYQSLEAERQKILHSDGFIRNEKKRFETVCAEMESMRHEYEVKSFGHELPSEKEEALVLRHPADVLRDAIRYTDECREDRCRWEEEQARITPEQREQMRKEAERIIRAMGREP